MAELKDWQIERLKCWDSILSDESLVAPLAGDSDNEKGKSILLAMKGNLGFESNSIRSSHF